MSRNVSGLDEILAGHFSSIIPEAEREFLGVAKSTVDVGVWLVGLSTGVIALFMTSESIKIILGECVFKAGIILFALVILFGVLQRILFHVAEHNKWPITLRLRGVLTGLTDKSNTAQELQDYWTVADIVDRLREDFGVDYSFLIENNASVEEARKSYIGQMEIHREFEKKGLDNLAKILCAHYGLPQESEENYFQPQDLDEIRKKAISTNKIFKASYLSYYLSAFFFVSGILLLAYGAI